MKTKFHYKHLLNFKWLIIGGICLLTATSCEKDEKQPPEPAPAPAPEPTEGAVVLPCNYFDTNTLLVNDTLKDVDYIIDCFMLVQNGEVIIEEGVTIEFSEHAGLSISDGARLIAEGTPEAPITLTGVEKTQGYWRGILINSDLSNSISHTTIEYAGSQNLTPTAPLYRGSLAAASGSQLHLSHVKVLNGGRYGLDFTGQNAEISVDHLTISGNNDYPVKVGAYNAHIFDSTSTFVGNAADYLNIGTFAYEIEEVVEWKKLDVPYLVDGGVHIKNNGFLTIAAGTEVNFRSAAYLQAHDNASPYNYGINVMGTPAEPVLLRAHNGTNWGGIYYNNSQENSIIKHTIIEHAKGDFSVENLTNTGAIFMRANPHVTIEDTEFRDLPNCAYYAYTGASTNQPDMPNLSTSNLLLTNVAGGEFCWGDGTE